MSYSAEAIYERHARYISPSFIKLLRTLGFARVFCRARGVELFDETGASYLDMLSGFGSVSLGYNHPELLAALRRVLDEEAPSFLHAAPLPEAGLLAEALAARL